MELSAGRVVLAVVALTAVIAFGDRRLPPRTSTSDVETAMDAALEKLYVDAGSARPDAGSRK